MKMIRNRTGLKTGHYKRSIRNGTGLPGKNRDAKPAKDRPLQERSS